MEEYTARYKCSRCGCHEVWCEAEVEGGGYWSSGCGCELEHEIVMEEIKNENRQSV